ncbi:alpha/beta-hydrolase [Meira miltonrushii]|uniref:Palmitoyl-protein thioesterase 1 n=1 Tax=Meira miltonrushii TaxID=1280837 RepID=A0A316VI54_9BASI|nr:alpha/beta-hydrolase [Meira miltonrushii]PWN37180.1 alpha/beta-hydrolase [Meira miltonrushii]
MHPLFFIGAVWALIATTINASPLFGPAFHPIVIWHGLGDSAYSQPMQELADQLRQAYPGVYVKLISLADDLSSDQRAGFFGNVNEEVEQVCQDLAMDDQLRDGFDAIGFSQGGQFLRAYVQRCNKPAVRNLITFGSQHMGISDLPACKPSELLCRLAEGALRGGIQTEYAQSHIVTAQYYRDPTSVEHYQRYLEVNKFIADINNEVHQNDEYKANLQSLDNLVLLMFDKDHTVEPKQSSWFASYPVPSNDSSTQGKDELEVEPLRQSSLYTEDRLGLKTLDKRGALVMELCKGVHMQINAACSMKVFGRYAGIAPPSKIIPGSVRHGWARTVYTLTGLRTGSVPGSVQFLFVLASVSFVLAITNGIRAVQQSRQRGSIRI